MKLNTINTDYKDYEKMNKHEVVKSVYQKETKYHPFMQQREYVRALNYTKIERLLAKPFLKAFTEPSDGIVRIQKHLTKDLLIVSCYDGSSFLYDINSKECMSKHVQQQEVSCYSKAVCFLEDNIIVTNNNKIEVLDQSMQQKSIFELKNNIFNIKENKSDLVVCNGLGLEILDKEYLASTQKILLGSIECCAYSKENNIFAVSRDEDLILIDKRTEEAFYTANVGTKTNSIAFSNSHYFVTGNADNNVYLHDIRYLENNRIYSNHVNEVLSVDYHPNIHEFISGSYDETIRIYKKEESTNRDVYYNKRMGHISNILYNTDGSKIISGGSDGSIRVWKSVASLKENISKFEQNNLKYVEILKKKYKNVAEIKRIKNHRFLPKKLKGQIRNYKEHAKAVKRKENKNK